MSGQSPSWVSTAGMGQLVWSSVVLLWGGERDSLVFWELASLSVKWLNF